MGNGHTEMLALFLKLVALIFQDKGFFTINISVIFIFIICHSEGGGGEGK